MTAHEKPSSLIDDVLTQLDQVTAPQHTGDGTSWKARCPAHNDSNPSLSITEKTDGTILVHCFAGCPQSDVRAALGLPSTLASGGGDWMPGGIRHEATYDYTDVDGELIFQVLRGRENGGKEFRQRVIDDSKPSGYAWSVKGLTLNERSTLYMLPAVAGAIESGELVYIVEGEKDVHSALRAGATATCNAGGAGKFTKHHAAHLTDAEVVVVQDKDEPGRKHGSQICRLLEGLVASVRLVEAADGKDLTDHLEAGHELDDLVEVEPDLAVVTELSGPRFDQWSESGVSERLAEAVRDRWCYASGMWHSWSGRLWDPHEDGTEFREEARKFAKPEAVRALTGSDEARKFAPKLLSRNMIKNIAELASGQLVRKLDDFDTDPDIAVVGNGVVALPTAELMPHDPERLVTKGTGVDYRPGATHPDWDAALEAVPAQVAAWLQVRLGQALTGHVPPDDKMLVFRGGGENGKSTLLGTVIDAMGDYAGIIPDKVLLGRPDDHSTEKMVLRGLRFAVQEETPEGKHLNINQIKKILGAPKITARLVHQNNVSFEPICAVVISTNYVLGVDEVDHGTWRRLVEVLFKYRYRDAKAGEQLERPDDKPGDTGLRERLRKGKEQQEAALAWLVEGARRWYENDRRMPQMPQEVRDDTEAWRRRSDQWFAYADDNLVIESGFAVWIDDLAREMGNWLLGRGHGKWSLNTFRSRIEANPWIQQTGVFLSGRERLNTLSDRLGEEVRLDRPPMSEAPLKAAPAQGQYLVGVRFRTPEDDESEEEGDGATSTLLCDGDDDATAPAPASAPIAKKRLPHEPGRPMPHIVDLDEDPTAPNSFAPVITDLPEKGVA